MDRNGMWFLIILASLVAAVILGSVCEVQKTNRLLVENGYVQTSLQGQQARAWTREGK